MIRCCPWPHAQATIVSRCTAKYRSGEEAGCMRAQTFIVGGSSCDFHGVHICIPVPTCVFMPKCHVLPLLKSSQDPLPLFVPGGGRRVDNGGIHDGALPEDQPLPSQMRCAERKQLLRKVVLLQAMPKLPIVVSSGTVSYTHLTLPTKRIV